MSIPDNSTGDLPNFTPAEERQALYLRRNHQQLQHFINRMLNRLEVPDQAARAISGLHGMLNGRTTFPVFKAHKFTARQLNFRGDDESARKFVGRALRKIRKAEWACGRKFFSITPASEDQAMTSYEADHLTPAAVWGLLEAKRSEEKNLSKAITDELVERAIAKLPKCDPPASEGEPLPLPLADYLRQREPRVLEVIEEFAEGVEERGGDADRILEKLEIEISRIRRSRLKTLRARRPPADEERRQRQLDAPLWGDVGAGTDTEAPPDEHAGEPGGEAATEVRMPAGALPFEVAPAGEGDGAEVAAEPTPPGQTVPPPSPYPPETDPLPEPDLPRWALWWASQGIPVLPLHSVFDRVCSCRDGTECRSAGKHPRTLNGVHDATTDEEKIGAWWARWPAANVGIAMGGPHRLVALDSDPRSGGDASVCDLVEAHGAEWLNTFTVRTGGLGHHFIFRLPDGVEVSRGKLAPGIDVKAGGGYLVAAPSLHATGRRYAIEQAAEIAEAPRWLVEELTRAPSQSPPKAVKFQERRARGTTGGEFIPQGERNRRVFEIGCAIWGQSKAADIHELYNQLLTDVYPRCEVTKDDPFTPEDVWKIAQSIMRYERGSPAAVEGSDER